MIWLVVDENGGEYVHTNKPIRDGNVWSSNIKDFTYLSRGTIEKIINKKLTWKDEPVKINLSLSEFFVLKSQLTILEQVVLNYPRKTIENIIQQIQLRIKG